MRQCTSCFQTLPLHCFYTNSNAPDGRRSKCKECQRVVSSAYKKKRRALANKGLLPPFKNEDKVSRTEYSLRKLYGISLEQYDKMREDQNYCCAVCLKHETSQKKRLSVDHSHTTGEIRGLLCENCNLSLIAQREDPDIFLRAADYLKKGSGIYVPEK
ncbi:endonuclease VII domain-containing protein [Thalassospira sp.]